MSGSHATCRVPRRGPPAGTWIACIELTRTIRPTPGQTRSIAFGQRPNTVGGNHGQRYASRTLGTRAAGSVFGRAENRRDAAGADRRRQFARSLRRASAAPRADEDPSRPPEPYLQTGGHQRHRGIERPRHGGSRGIRPDQEIQRRAARCGDHRGGAARRALRDGWVRLCADVGATAQRRLGRRPSAADPRRGRRRRRAADGPGAIGHQRRRGSRGSARHDVSPAAIRGCRRPRQCRAVSRREDPESFGRRARKGRRVRRGLIRPSVLPRRRLGRSLCRPPIRRPGRSGPLQPR